MSGALSVEQCIDMMRAALRRLDIPERDVKVTWNESGWARFRAKLPSGRIVDRTERVGCPAVREERVYRANLTTLAQWLRDVAKAHPSDLDVAFADHVVPAEGARS